MKKNELGKFIDIVNNVGKFKIVGNFSYVEVFSNIDKANLRNSERPDILIEFEGKHYGIEHFQVDSAPKVKRSSTLQRKKAENERKFDKIEYDEDGNKVLRETINGLSYKLFKENFLKILGSHIEKDYEKDQLDGGLIFWAEVVDPFGFLQNMLYNNEKRQPEPAIFRDKLFWQKIIQKEVKEIIISAEDEIFLIDVNYHIDSSETMVVDEEKVGTFQGNIIYAGINFNYDS